MIRQNRAFIKHFSLFLIFSAFIFSLSTQYTYSLPSFARQTGMACSNCHITFPQLNQFGRQFKLNGYTLAAGETVEAQTDSGSSLLKIMKNLPFSSMVQTSVTHLTKEIPGTANDNISFPQQLSFFMAGEITPKIGIFLQVTYNDEDGSFGWDNTDIRYADNTTLFSNDFTYGFSLNNSPTVQDLWNTTPAWGFPFATPSDALAPTPGAGPLIAGAFAQQVFGLTTYGLWDNLIYGEVGFYRSAQQGGSHPADANTSMFIKGLMPYWRLAVQQSFDNNYISVGTFGLMANVIPNGIDGAADKYTDIGADLQFEHQMGYDYLTAYLTWMHENQSPAPFTDSTGTPVNITNTLSTIRLNVNYFFCQRLNLGLGYFSTTGSANDALYSAANGYSGNVPDSQGLIGEFDYVPWFNTKFALQYTMYSKFNGGSTNYDGSGRNASDNNALYLAAWFMF